jgi:hypothetical protein
VLLYASCKVDKEAKENGNDVDVADEGEVDDAEREEDEEDDEEDTGSDRRCLVRKNGRTTGSEVGRGAWRNISGM